MRGLVNKLALAVLLIVAGAAACQGQITVSWTPSGNPACAGYNVCWGTSSSNYTVTNVVVPGTNASLTISNLATNQLYYFVVQAFSASGDFSPFSSEMVFTNGAVTNGAVTNGLPLNTPPLPGGTQGTTNSGGTSNGQSSGGTSGSGTSSNGGTDTGANGGANNVAQALFWGVPPVLTMVVTNGQPLLNLGATVGATLSIQTATDVFSPDSWATVTNIAVTDIAAVAATNNPGQPQDALDVAFVPGSENITAPVNNRAPVQYYRAYMPYDYVILADMVLPAKGYTPRLIVVNMPGIICDDVCYVNESSSFIHFNRTNDALQLEASGSTIRQIAGSLAGSMNLDWTSASEFTYSNGLGQILATVIETDPPSSDPVAGQNPPSPPIVINF